MMYRLTIGLLLGLLGLASCAGQSARPAANLRLEPFNTSLPTGGARLSRSADEIRLSFPALGPDGAFLHLRLPEGRSIVASEWSQSADLLQLVVPLPGGADLGVVPLPGSAPPPPLTLTLRLAAAPRRASSPPAGAVNTLSDLALEQGGAGQVRLSWTEVNRGDYDFNSEVNVADLQPLAKLFQSSYDLATPDLRNQTAFWVDGDGNGEINASDLTVIAKHYGAQIAGYSILRNGTVLPGPNGTSPSIPRSAAQSRRAEQLPPRYVTVRDGSLLDNWSVLPVDGGGNAGDGNPLPPLPVDLSVKFSSSGLDLHSLDGSGSGQAATGRSRLSVVPVDEVMRRIDPGDVVNDAELGDVLGASSGNAGFTDLPRGEWLLVQVAFAPTVDPATGLAWPYPTHGSAPHYRCLDVPVKLPPGSLSSQLTLSAHWVKQKVGNYKVYLTSQLSAGSLRLNSLTELDYAAALVSSDTNNDGLLSDELRLSDTRLCGLSSHALQQLEDDNIFAGGTRVTAAVSGRFSSLDEAAGLLRTSTSQLSIGGAAPSDEGLLELRLTEQTTINEDILSAAGTLSREISPDDLLPGDLLLVKGYLLDGVAGEAASLWVSSVTRQVDTSKPDKLYAWPSQTSALPGEQVTITISSEQSANPFYRLDALRVTWNNAEYVHDSLNAGEAGGSRSTPDGIWSQIGASSVMLPNEVSLSLVQLSGGRLGLDLFAIPDSGGELLPATGALLNFKLSILGDVTLGLQRLDDGGIKRSYYSDVIGNEYFWSDDFNSSAPGIVLQNPGGPGEPG